LGVTAVNTLGYISAPPSVSIAGGAPSQLLYQSAPNVTNFIPNGTLGRVLLSNGAGVPSWGQVDLTTGVTNVLPIAQGGTNSSTRQQAMDTLAGATTLGQYLRGNGTNVVMSPIIAADVPTLNQNTTGSAATFTSTTQNSQFNSIGVNVAASGTAGQINATGNVQTSAGFFSDGTGTLHPIVSATAVAASGATIPFGSIPTWAVRVTVLFDSVTNTGGNYPELRLGTSGGIVSAGYTWISTNFVGNVGSTSGFNIPDISAASVINGSIILYNITGNTWVAELHGTLSNVYQAIGSGRISLAGDLSQVLLTFTGAGPAYNGGTVNVMWE
jgi:hypothetical protein